MMGGENGIYEVVITKDCGDKKQKIDPRQIDPRQIDPRHYKGELFVHQEVEKENGFFLENRNDKKMMYALKYAVSLI